MIRTQGNNAVAPLLSPVRHVSLSLHPRLALQVNEMIVDDDLVTIRDQLVSMRAQYKADAKPGPFGFGGFKNPLKSAAESIGVEWKD